MPTAGRPSAEAAPGRSAKSVMMRTATGSMPLVRAGPPTGSLHQSRRCRMHARIGRITLEHDNADDVTTHVRDNVVPKYEDADGFKGFTLLIDRLGGQAIGISFWENEEAMRASDSLGDQARQG